MTLRGAVAAQGTFNWSGRFKVSTFFERRNTRFKRDDAARASGGTAGGPSGLDVRSTPGARFPVICTRQGLARCCVR